MSISNTAARITDLAADTCKAVTSHDARIAKLAKDFAAIGVSDPAAISRGGTHLAPFMAGVARATLSPKQLETWADESLATKAGGKLTARGTLQTRVASAASKTRAALAKAWKGEASGEGEGKGKGAGGSKGAPHAVDMEKIASVRKRIVTLAASDKPADKEKIAAYGDAKAIIAALDTAIAAFAKK